MKKPDTVLDEIHATRRTIEKQTKNMTRSERTAYFNQAGAALLHVSMDLNVS